MTAHLAADPDVAWLAAAAGAVWWLHRRGRLRSLTRRVGRLAAAVAAVVLAATVSTSAVVVVVAVIGCLAIGGRHTRRRTQFQRWFQHGYDRARHTQYRRHGRRGSNVAYSQWMASSGWRRQRQAALERANFRCAIRGCIGAPLEVHHNNARVYEHLARARPSDLDVVCVSHHRLISDLHQHRGYSIEAATARVIRGDVYAA